MTATLDLTTKTEFGHSFATRERARDLVAEMALSPDEPVLLRVGELSMCAPGFLQGLLAAFGQSRLVLVEARTCPAPVRERLEWIAVVFGTRLEFS